MTNLASQATSAVSGQLIRGIVLILFAHKVGPLATAHVAGDDNDMPDITSRPTRTKRFFCSNTNLSDTEFLRHFSSAFPLPFQAQWKMAQPDHRLISNVFETLRGKQLEMQRWMVSRESGTGMPGRTSAAGKTSTSTSKTPRTNSKSTPPCLCCHQQAR